MSTAKKPVAPVAKAVHAATKPVSAIGTAMASTTEQFAKAETEAVKDFLQTGSAEVQRNQEKAMNFGRESMEKWTENTDKAMRSANEAMAMGNDHFNAMLESSKTATEIGKELHESFVAEINELFSENVELSKELLACRSLTDLMDVHNRALQTNLSHFFNNSARMTEAWFKLATEVSEPLNAQASQVSKRLNNAFA